MLWSDIALLRGWLPQDCAIQIGYSSTEAPIMQWFVPPLIPPDEICVPIGYPLAGNNVAIVDDDGNVACAYADRRRTARVGGANVVLRAGGDHEIGLPHQLEGLLARDGWRQHLHEIARRTGIDEHHGGLLPEVGPRAADLTANYVTGPYRYERLDASHWMPEEVPEVVARLVLGHVGEGGHAAAAS